MCKAILRSVHIWWDDCWNVAELVVMNYGSCTRKRAVLISDVNRRYAQRISCSDLIAQLWKLFNQSVAVALSAIEWHYYVCSDYYRNVHAFRSIACRYRWMDERVTSLIASRLTWAERTQRIKLSFHRRISKRLCDFQACNNFFSFCFACVFSPFLSVSNPSEFVKIINGRKTTFRLVFKYIYTFMHI